VGLVTCLSLPEPDLDDRPLREALRAAGLQPELLAWDDAGADPGRLDLCVLRSCWNYYRDPGAFLGWVERAAARTRLWNPVEVVRWNLHKGYLRELEAEGVPIVPTEWVERGASCSLAELRERRRWDELVIKPAISAASFGTRRFGAQELLAAQAYLDSELEQRDLRWCSNTCPRWRAPASGR
jgi:hypothetical protein